MNDAHRVLVILRRLQKRPATIADLIRLVGGDKSDKTIRRDLATIRAAGFFLCETVEEFGRKRFSVKVIRGK